MSLRGACTFLLHFFSVGATSKVQKGKSSREQRHQSTDKPDKIAIFLPFTVVGYLTKKAQNLIHTHSNDTANEKSLSSQAVTSSHRLPASMEPTVRMPTDSRVQIVLQNVVTFKEVVEIPDDATKSKIHATFRIAYIRDAVLPRALDDASFAALHTTMIFNYMDFLASLQQSPAFFQTLFEKLRTVDIHCEQAAQLMSFLQVRAPFFFGSGACDASHSCIAVTLCLFVWRRFCVLASTLGCFCKDPGS